MNRSSFANSKTSRSRFRALDLPEDVLLYEYDGSVEKGRPDVVVFPHTTQRSPDIVTLAAQASRAHRWPRRGYRPLRRSARARWRCDDRVRAHESHPRARLSKIIARSYNPESSISELTRAVEHAGLYFAPDPSSQKSCTIGGNVAENAGGPHTLAYGVTTNHVTALELVLPDGRNRSHRQRARRRAPATISLVFS